MIRTPRALTGISRTKVIAACSNRKGKRLPFRVRDIDLPDAMSRARHARNRGVDVTAVLEEVEMAPRLLRNL